MHQLIPRERLALRKKLNTPSLAVGIRLPAPLLQCLLQAVEQLIDRPPAINLGLVAQQDEVTAGVQCSDAAFDRAAEETGTYRLLVTFFESVNTGELVVARD